MTISPLRTLATLFVVASLTGCVIKDIVKSELSAYAEPSSGELAHIRLVGSRNVKVYPASTCPSIDVPGGGYPQGPQMGGQRKRDLGMPKTGAEPKHFVEIAARGDEPITTAFQVGEYRGRFQVSCYVANTFVPQQGHNYEVEADMVADGCVALLYEIVPDGTGGFVRTLARTKNAECPKPAPANT